MKRVILILLIFILFISGCTQPETKEKETVKGVWISYSELDSWLLSGDFKAQFLSAAENCKELGITDLFVHIRPFCDSYYPSEYYPLRSTAQSYDFDVLEYITECTHQNGMRLHGWINPYRVRTADSDINNLPENSPARKWLEDETEENDTAVSFSNGIYLNPAHQSTEGLILNGIKEVIENYDIDGIHFDDYFYPTEDTAFDEALYETYKEKNTEALELKEWRRQHINSLISSTKRVINSKDSKLVFSISPAASIDKNYESLCADIVHWVDNGYMDWLMPQLYFGFDYPEAEYRFDNLMSIWQEIAENSNVKLIIGLASYKIGTDIEYEAKEWSRGNLLAEQTRISLENTYGCCFFSYSSLFGTADLQVKERENLTEALKNVYP